MGSLKITSLCQLKTTIKSRLELLSVINLRSPLSRFMICRLSFRALIGGGDQPDEDGKKTLNFSEIQKNHRKERKVLQDKDGEKALKNT